MKLRFATYNLNNRFGGKALLLKQSGAVEQAPTNFQNQFPHFPEVTNKTTQASDHAAIVAEFSV